MGSIVCFGRKLTSAAAPPRKVLDAALWGGGVSTSFPEFDSINTLCRARGIL